MRDQGEVCKPICWQDRLIRYGEKGRQLTVDEHRSLQCLAGKEHIYVQMF